ncbi:hypothetical protein [Legionella sp.]|uniref:hypothetical protein n=1 Tax=Legionella sp. TaxID=459 RepID=UPI00321FD2B2
MNIHHNTKSDRHDPLKQHSRISKHQALRVEKSKSKMTTRRRKIKKERSLDEALKETFPASDSVTKY